MRCIRNILIAIFILLFAVFVTRLLHIASVVGASKAATVEFTSSKKTSEDVSREIGLITKHLSRRYHVNALFVEHVVMVTYQVAERTRTDPILLLAIISTESAFNVNAEGSQGEIGLMQIHPRYQAQMIVELGGEAALWDPDINILAGARILRRAQLRYGNTLKALEHYNGDAGAYAPRVVQRYFEIQGAIHGKLTGKRH